MKNIFTPRFIFITIAILVAAISRMIPHMQNFSPLGAIGLFGAAYFTKKWQAFIIPISATFLSDLFINNVWYAEYNPNFVWFYGGFYWQYGSYLLIALAAILIFNKVNPGKIAIAALSSTAIFFLITNAGCWLGNPLYPQNFGGLMSCYAVGIPFLKGTLLGDLFYSTVLFGAFYFVQRRYPILVKVK
ncbi:MAG: hypothetical protein H0W84_04780 [Bacteroidetes bacterium]|nr:hypothetical protein [Bacteroidota bacterium]